MAFQYDILVGRSWLIIMKKYDVILIGGSGFLARNILASFSDLKRSCLVMGRKKIPENHFNDFLEFDLLKMDSQKFSENYGELQADTVIFNSALKGRFECNDARWIEQGKIIAPDLNFLKHIKFKKLLTIGTSEEYGPRLNQSLISEADECLPVSSYGYWKYSLYKKALVFCNETEIQFCHMRPFNIYGIGSDPEMFVRSMIESLITRGSFDMTKGEQFRSYAHIQTVVRTINALIDAAEPWSALTDKNCLNVSDDTYISIAQVADLVVKLIPNGTVNKGVLPYRDQEVWHQKPSLKKIMKLLGPSFSSNFESKIEEIVLHYKGIHNIAR